MRCSSAISARSSGVTSGSALATVRRRGILLAVALAILASVIVAIARLELGAGLLEAARLVLATAFVALLAAGLWSGRHVISAALISDTDSLAARLWPWLALAYLAGALALFVAKVLAGEPVNGLAILAPIYCGAIAAVAYALCMALLFRWWTARAAGPGSADPASLAGTVPGDAAAAEVPTLTDRAAADAAATSGAVAAAVWAGGIALAWVSHSGPRSETRCAASGPSF